MKRALVIHPFLIALYPILFIYAKNIEQLSLSQIWTSVVALEGFTAIMLVLFALLLRSAAKAGGLLSLFLLLFFSFGPTHRALWHGGTEVLASGSLILLGVWVVIFVGGAALFIGIKRGLRESTMILNVVAVVLVAYSLVNIGIYELRRATAVQDAADDERIQLAQANPPPVEALPDIYYIILDGYARADILEELYGHDNAEFLDFLGQRGFFVAKESQANYAQTILSLTSALNLGYLDDLAARVGPESGDLYPLERLFDDNLVVQFLQEQGYVIATFTSGYTLTTLDAADVYVGSGPPWNELEIALLASTPIPWMVMNQSQFDPYAPHIARIKYTFEHLAGTAELESPHFVFAHVVAPHPPFVFDERGNELELSREYTIEDGNRFIELGGTREEYLERYPNQLRFVNAQMMAALDALLAAQSSRPAIIILQADHGPGLLLDWSEPENTYFAERLSILNAIRLPGGNSAGLYDEITPVNTFRLIFNEYFGTELELLEDRSYFSTSERPYRFLDVTDRVRSGELPQ
jgi:hypothetical protein